jgi:hypothetical protein
MKEAKKKKAAKKAFKDLVASGYVVNQLRTIFMMQDYSDNDVIHAFKDAAKMIREQNEDKWTFRSKKKSDYDDFDESFGKARPDPNDKTKLVKHGRTTDILNNLDSILGN